MSRFVYVGGKEWDGTELPAATTVFGLRFVEGVERAVDLRDFKSPNEFEHAIRKLSFHPHFKRVDEVADVVEHGAGRRVDGVARRELGIGLSVGHVPRGVLAAACLLYTSDAADE